MICSTDQRREIYGVDFSGAAEAGTRIWVARGTVQENRLSIEECLRGDELPGSDRGRLECLAALKTLVESHPQAVFGFDFPFSIPAGLIRRLFGDVTWEQFVLSFRERFPTPRQFRDACVQAAGGRELRRDAGQEWRAPYSSYNIRLYLQTYYGIADLLRPLVQGETASILPMQQALPSRPWLLEICPASTLKRIEIYIPYKGRTPSHLSARAAMVMSVEKKGPLSFADQSLRQKALDNPGGDALDSVVAAFAVFKNLQDPSLDIQHPLRGTESDGAESLEGFLYA